MGERKIGFVYFIGAFDGGSLRAVKIGWTTDPHMRLGDLQTGNHSTLVLLATREGTRAEERRLHLRFGYTTARGDARSEWFAPTPEMTELLRQLGAEGAPAGYVPTVKAVAQNFAWILARRSANDIEVERSRRAFSRLK